ncbi:MAG: FAD-dependent monooxygenase, partial [Pseudomonas sp.]
MNNRPASPPDTRSDIDVLIVGAGPAGMILAHELLRRGVRCRMVEKREGPSGSTRAFTVHSRSMEMFDHMGLANRVSELREICPGNRFHFRGVDLTEGESTVLDFRRLPATQYNYYGKVNQSDLDQALRHGLAAQHDFHPEYGVEFISCEQDGPLVRARLRRSAETPDRDEFLSVSWLVGADGARSTVRSGLGLSFEQTEGTSMTMSMVDVELSGFQGDRSWVNYFVGDNGFMLVTGLPGGKYRLYLAGEMEQLLASGTAQEAFQKGLDYFNTGAVITKMAWSSSWDIRKIVGDVYRQGRILLCGDATHVHSPAGGQGMNACMQDAFNLGWKLALVVKEKGAPGILDSYREERRPIARQVTEGADRMHQILFNASIPVAQRFRLTQDPAWHDEAILRISGLSHNYRGIDGVVADIELTEGAVLPGERA